MLEYKLLGLYFIEKVENKGKAHYTTKPHTSLGPLLFIIYINDLSKVSSKCDPFMYADDSSLFFTGTTPNKLINKANVELIKVFEWLKANKLSVNIKKKQVYVTFEEKTLPSDFRLF